MSFQFLSMLGAFEFFNGIMPYMREVLVGIFFGYILYFSFLGLSLIITFVQKLFNMFAGLDPFSLSTGGPAVEGQDDLILGVLKNEAVQTAFWSILGICIVLLVVFTIVAVLKSEFSLKYASKAPIITRALTSFANFLMIPVIFIVGIYAMSALLKVVDKAFTIEDTNNSLSYRCFKVGSSGANRARNDLAFAKYLKDGTWLQQTDRATKNPFKSLSLTAVADRVDAIFDGKKDSEGNLYSKLLTGDLISLEGAQCYANSAVLEKHDYEYRYTHMDDVPIPPYIDWHVSLFEYPDFSEGISIFNIATVNYFYDFASFNYILAIGSAVVVGWTLLTVCLLLIKRILEMLILFLLAPVMTAVAPLDNGNAEKKLRGEFLKRLLAVIGPVFAYNLFFIILGIFGSLSPFTDGNNVIFGVLMNKVVLGAFDIMFQIAIIIVGLGLMKTANTMFTSMLGMEDMLGQADANAKKTIGTASKVALAGTAVGGLAFKATGSAAKLAGKGFVGAGKAGAKGVKWLGGKKDILKADRDEDENNEAIANEEVILDKASKQGDEEAVRMSTERIKNLKEKGAGISKIKERDDYKLHSAKKNIKDIKGKPIANLEDAYENDELISKENDKILAIKQEQAKEKTEKRGQRKEKFDASLVGRKLQDLKQGVKQGNFPLPLKDIFGASAGKMFGRLGESLGGLSGESGQAVLNLFKKDERKSFYNSKEEIAEAKGKRDKSKKDYTSEKESQLEFLKRGVAREKGSEVEVESKRLNDNLANAKKDGILSEQIAAKKELEKFEVKNGITKQAEIMQASINNVSDKGHFENLDKVNEWIKGARKQAEDEATAKTNKELENQREANKDVFKESLGETNKKLEDLLNATKHNDLGIDQKSSEQLQLEQMTAIAKGINSLGDMLQKFEKKEETRKQNMRRV